MQVLLFTDPESREKITFIEVKLYQITQIQHKHMKTYDMVWYITRKNLTHNTNKPVVAAFRLWGWVHAFF